MVLPAKLRPAKVRNALQRRWFERRMSATPLRPCASRLVDLGTTYGGWTLPVDLIGDGWVC
jgi:hypothetical protein